MPLNLRSGQLGNAPKRLYYSTNQLFIKESQRQHPNLTFKQLNQEWEKISEEDLEEYQNQYQNYMLEYNEELLKFYGHSKKDIKNIQKQREKELSKPSPPLSAQLLYQHNVYNQVKIENPELSYFDIRRVIQQMYLLLDDNEKKYLQEQNDKEKQLYQQKLEAWKKKYQNNSEQDENQSTKFYQKQKKGEEDFYYVEYVRAQKNTKTKKMIEILPKIIPPKDEVQQNSKQLKLEVKDEKQLNSIHPKDEDEQNSIQLKLEHKVETQLNSDQVIKRQRGRPPQYPKK